MGSIAFALSEEYAGTIEVFDTVEDHEAGNGREVPVFQGGNFARPDGTTFDVGAELEEGDGIIVVDDRDQVVVESLKLYPALKQVPVPEDREALTEYDGASRAALRAEAKWRGLAGSGTKEELAERLKANDAAVQAGDQEAAAAERPEETTTTGAGA